MSELALILVVAMLIFGPGMLPDVMGKLGQGVKQFKDGQREFEEASRAAMRGEPEEPRGRASDRGGSRPPGDAQI
jgi:sec-independent protein translocase protein TatA